jgi:hypothetical protein
VDQVRALVNWARDEGHCATNPFERPGISKGPGRKNHVPLTEADLVAQHCGRSLTWVERHMRTGMPHRKDTPTAWPMFRLSEVDAWLRSRGKYWEAAAG